MSAESWSVRQDGGGDTCKESEAAGQTHLTSSQERWYNSQERDDTLSFLKQIDQWKESFSHVFFKICKCPLWFLSISLSIINHIIHHRRQDSILIVSWIDSKSGLWNSETNVSHPYSETQKQRSLASQRRKLYTELHPFRSYRVRRKLETELHPLLILPLLFGPEKSYSSSLRRHPSAYSSSWRLHTLVAEGLILCNRRCVRRHVDTVQNCGPLYRVMKLHFFLVGC